MSETSMVASAFPAAGLLEAVRPSGGASRIFASPLARRLAGSAGIGLLGLAGTGPGGRIVKRDIERHARERREVVPFETDNPREAPARAETEIKPKPEEAPNGWRRYGFRLGAVVCVDDVLEALKKFGGANEAGADLSIGGFAVRAASWALRRVPELNASSSASTKDIDIACLGFVGSRPIHAVVRNADRMGLRALHDEIYGRASATGPNTGRYETEPRLRLAFLDSAVIHEYEIKATAGVVLAVSGVQRQTILNQDLSVAASCLTAALTAGPGAADPISCSRFLTEFCAALERPIRMIL